MSTPSVVAICLSPAKGTGKTCQPAATLRAGHGLVGDAHAGDWHRQISILPLERIEEFQARGARVNHGDFGENLVVRGIRLDGLRIGDRVRVGDAVLELTQFGKECHDRCHIYESMGDCIMPRCGVFARVLKGADIAVGDAVSVQPAYTVALLTASGKGSIGERADTSGDVMAEMAAEKGLRVVERVIVPDDADAIAAELTRFADDLRVNLVLTSGGTGFSRRDVTPEATLRVVERLTPGIPEAMRSLSLAVSKKAMLSRAVAGIRMGTLIVNLPGSPKAVRECLGFVLDELIHGLEVLAGDIEDCALTRAPQPGSKGTV